MPSARCSRHGVWSRRCPIRFQEQVWRRIWRAEWMHKSAKQIIESRVNLAEAIGVPVRALLHIELSYDFTRGATNEFATDDLRRLAPQNRSDIAEIDRSAAAHCAAQKQLAARLARLSARETTLDAIAAQVKDGARSEVELLLWEARVAAARPAVFDAQVQVQHTLGALEDTVRQPAELFGTACKRNELVSTHE